MGVPVCPLCGKTDRVINLPVFVAAGGHLGALLAARGEDAAALEFTDFADWLALPEMPAASFDVIPSLRFPRIVRKPTPAVLKYVQSLAKWYTVYDWWQNAYVCAGKHPQEDETLPPLGLRVFYKGPNGEWVDVAPTWFAAEMDLML